MRVFHYFLAGVFLLLTSSMAGQSTPLTRQARFDSIYQEMLSYPLDSQTLDTYAMFINGQIAEDLQNAKRLVVEVDQKFRGVELPPFVRGKFATISGMAYFNSGSLDTAMQYFQRGKTMFERAEDSFGLGVVLSSISAIDIERGNLEAATEARLEYLDLVEATGDSLDVGRALILVGELLYERDRREAANSYFTKGHDKLDRFLQQIPERTDIWYSTLQLINNAAYTLALLEQEEGQLEQAQKWIDKAIRTAELTTQPMYLARSYEASAELHYSNGRSDEALEDFELAQQYYRQLDGQLQEPRMYAKMSSIYLDREQPETALPLLHRYLSFLTSHPDIRPDPTVYRELVRVHGQLKNPDSVVLYQESLIELMDSIYRIETDARVEEVQTRYETEKKDATIRSQRSELDQQRRVQLLTFGIVALLALLGGLLFFGLRRQRRTSQELARRNEQNKFLVKEIHHRTKNNLQVLSSLLALQNDYITDPAALDAVTEGRNRVQSIGLLHQQLYTGTELEKVDPQQYFPNLGDHLLDTFGREDDVEIQYRIELPLLPVDEAISLGLIANELLTNSLKYAYPSGTPGTIYFELHEEGRQKVLRIRDEGGSSPNTTEQGTGFGRDLIDLLRLKLKGTIQEERLEKGWTTVVRW